MNTQEARQAVKLAEAKAAVKAARKQAKAARNLLERAINAIPDYTDGRNDRLVLAIDKWLATPDA